MDPQPPLTAIDLFSGAGGFSAGLARAGFEVIGAVDAWPVAVETYGLNFSHPALRADVGTLTAAAFWRGPERMARRPAPSGVPLMTRFLVVELCAGTAVLSRALAALGWETFTVDADPQHRPDWCGDVRALAAHPVLLARPAFVWCAPPCPEFSRHDQPWTKARKPPPPDLSITDACHALVRSWRPPWWCIENVRGARPWYEPRFGPPRVAIGRAHYLYGALPPLPPVLRGGRQKQSRSSSATAARGSYPPHACAQIAEAVDRAVRFFGDSSPVQRCDS